MKLKTKMAVITLAVALGSCATTKLRAQVVVVPNALATNDGATYTTTPPGGPTSVREMQIFDASQFAALSGASFLTQFALRPDMIPNASGPRSVNLRIYASTTTRSVAGLSMTFADNLGADNTLVFSGTLNWATGNLPGPGNTRQFDVVFPFTTPFLYNPAAGNLLLDIQLSGNGQSITFDAVTGNSMARKIVNTSSSNATTAAFVAPNQVIQFTFEPPPLVAPTFSDANWGSMGGISGADNTVSAVVVDGSCNLYIGGEFNLPGEVIAHHVAKWTGSGWTALGSGMSGSDYPYVSALAVSGSNLYAGGSFTTAGGSAANYVAKWDGSSWSALGSGMDGWVMALAVSGSNLYAAGEFSTAGGSSATNIAKWNGSSWSALGSGLGLVSDGSFVRALAVSGSDVYVGGHFTTAGASTANYIAKWNGSSWTALGSGMNGTVNALAVSGSTLYAGGSFTTAGGSSTTNRIAKWDGSSWTALDSGSGLVNTNPTDVVVDVRALEVSGSDLYAGGWFTTADGSCKGIAKWDGSSWTALGSGIGGDIYARVLALAVSGSDLYAGGDFTTAGGKASAYTARAYLPSLPTLSVIRSSENVTVSWPAVDTAGFALEQASPLAAPAGWITNSATVTNDGTKKSVTLPAMNSSQFFRLRRP